MEILVSRFNHVADIHYRAAGHRHRTVSAGERSGRKEQVLVDCLSLARTQTAVSAGAVLDAAGLTA
jgi:hypothetical protein